MPFNQRSFFLAATAIELALLLGYGLSQYTGNCTNVIHTTFGGAAGDTLAFILPRGTVFPRTFSLPRGIVTVSIRSLGARGASHRLVGVVPGASRLRSSTLARRALLLIPQFYPHRPGTVVEQQGMETCDWSIRRTAAHTGPDNYRMCPYSLLSHIRRLRFSALSCVSPRKSRYRNDCRPVAHLTRTGSEENLKKKKNLESAWNWPLESQ